MKGERRKNAINCDMSDWTFYIKMPIKNFFNENVFFVVLLFTEKGI